MLHPILPREAYTDEGYWRRLPFALGLFWGGSMWLTFAFIFVFPFLLQGPVARFGTILGLNTAVWLLGGTIFGLGTTREVRARSEHLLDRVYYDDPVTMAQPEHPQLFHARLMATLTVTPTHGAPGMLYIGEPGLLFIPQRQAPTELRRPIGLGPPTSLRLELGPAPLNYVQYWCHRRRPQVILVTAPAGRVAFYVPNAEQVIEQLRGLLAIPADSPGSVGAGR